MKRISADRRKAFIAMLATLCVSLMITGYAQTQKADELATQVNIVLHKSLYEAEELLAGVQLNLQKLIVSNSSAHRQAMLDDIIRQSEAAADDLSTLRQNQASLEGAIKFTNQVGDYARTLSKRISLGGDLDEIDLTQLNAMLAGCVSLNAELIEGIRKLDSGEIDISFSDDIAQSDVEPAVNYPVLLYDGPFSDAVGDEEFVPYGEEVSPDTAAEALRRFIGYDRVRSVAFTGQSDIMSKCYEFDVETASGNMTAVVTSYGGHVLYMLPEDDITQANLTREECIQRGARFLSERGFGEMDARYWRRREGILTVNYVPVTNGVLLYPDLIKLQISMADGAIVGAETGNYLRNHIERVLTEPVIDEAQAMSLVNPLFSITGVELCVIPLDNSEYLCWEIRGFFEGGEGYLIYIDAVNSQERAIMQLVESDEGVLTQ